MNSMQCSNRLCKKGSGGEIATFIQSRDHHKYCCQSCRVEAWREKQSGGSRIIELEKRVKELEDRIEDLETGYKNVLKWLEAL